MDRSDRVESLLAAMESTEKADVVTGSDMWTTGSVERLDVAALTVTDGPNGARGGGLMGTGTATACIPAGAVLGASWDPDLLERLGGLLGDEAIAKGANVLLAPTINLHRSPLGGRNFECYSEDPYLTGVLAAAFIRGVQSRNVATTPKHLVGNDSEFERNTIDVQVDERTLREVYLLPFEMAIKEGGAWGVMSAYNRLNGSFCSEHRWLLTQVLREDWGFDGFVVSDWFAARTTADSVRAGLSLEMPGPGRFYGRENLIESLNGGAIDLDDLNALAGDVLTAMERTGAFDGAGGGAETTLDRPDDRLLAREAAVAGAVLLRNDGSLPLDRQQLGSVALIGPNAARARVMGGGSAKVHAYRESSPLDALRGRLDGVAELKYAEGCNIDRSVAALGPPLLQSLLQVEYFAGHQLAGEVLATGELPAGEFIHFGAPAAGVPEDEYSMRLKGTIRSEVSGEVAVQLVQCGRTRIYIDGALVLDASEGEFETGDAFFGLGTAEIEASTRLEAGTPVDLVVEFSNENATLLAGATIGLASLVDRDLLTEAETVAADADVAIVVVGTNDDWETEGRDRDLFELPGDQPELIRRVAAANERTIVVVNAGGPHGMDWLDVPAAVLQVGFGGQELGEALVDILLGDADPGGRMPTSIPKLFDHAPAALNYPGENSVVRYGEGIFVGHRWFDRRQIEPLIPFGYGLSYGSYEWGPPQLTAQAPTDFSIALRLDLEIANVGHRPGSEVVQIYVEPLESRLARPVRELKGFAKLEIQPGQSATATIELGARAFAYFDPGDPDFAAMNDAMPVPTGVGKERRTEPGWYVEPGHYRVHAARSSADLVHTVEIELVGDEVRYPA
jgi:beta-glucosidase